MSFENPDLRAAPARCEGPHPSLVDSCVASGSRGLTISEHREFRAVRLGALCQLIRKHHSPARPLQILDAGCGEGSLTHALRSFGHHALGIDSNESSIAAAIEAYGKNFECTELADYRPDCLFDVVVCLDSLVRIVSDNEWSAALQKIAEASSSESLLIVSDLFGDTRSTFGDDMVHRTKSEYLGVLAPLDFELIDLISFEFGVNSNFFGVFRRSIA